MERRMTREIPFDFTDEDVVAAADTCVARLPENLANKEELLQALYEQLQFPGYFGFNWDALSDCLRDFHWLASRTVVLMHADLPRLTPHDCRTYLAILAEAVDSWKREEEHEFRVVFPTVARAEAAAVLAK
jgi:RNAse (barnase) inhibitor barstar